MTGVTGVVVALDGDYSIVRVDGAGCGRCYEPGGCGGHDLGKMFCAEPQNLRVLNSRCVIVGERVSVATAEGVVRRCALLAYALPLILFFAGAILGGSFAGELGAIFGSLIGLLLTWFALRFVRLQKQAELFIR